MMIALSHNVLKSHPAICSVDNTCSTVGNELSRSDVSSVESKVSSELIITLSRSDTLLKYRYVLT